MNEPQVSGKEESSPSEAIPAKPKTPFPDSKLVAEVRYTYIKMFSLD
jgi:hypothetical protein